MIIYIYIYVYMQHLPNGQPIRTLWECHAMSSSAKKMEYMHVPLYINMYIYIYICTFVSFLLSHAQEGERMTL